ncbi:hypothetical protein B0H13DRAFT_2477783 [Mycena leptocephala]|nr:hypothetical protein B0H13DRAFT_2477783 [Mycena leptocephala]
MAHPTTLSELALGLRLSESEAMPLPFTLADPSDELIEHSVPGRKLGTINYVTVEIWKSLRIPQTKTKSVPQDLSMLPGMHLDIMLEILGHLHPVMLLQVSRTSKSFRRLLRSPITDLTWRHSFLVDARLPDCPPQISGRRWAKLLFGPQICDECDQPNTEPDYIIWRRVCTACMDENLLDEMPGSHELNSMLHRTLRAGGGPRDGTIHAERGRFWRSDGAGVAALYEAHNSQGGPEAVCRFVKSQLAVVSENRDRAARCRAWARHALSNSRVEIYARVDQITGSAIRCLVSEGFHKRDAAEALYSVYEMNEYDALWRMPRLTSRVWRRARPHVVPHILIARTDRLEREHEWRMRDRKQVILGTAIMALRTPVVGSPHLFHPPPHAIEAFPPITQLIDEDSLEPLPAMTHDSPPLSLTPPKTQALLAALIPGADAEQPDLGLLDRAMSVFRIRKPGDLTTRTAIGWDDARGLLHWCSGYPASYLRREKLVQFNMRGALTATALVTLLGLNADTTKAAEMDTADARFMCGRCPGVIRRQAMQWRDCVMHDVENADSCTSPHSAPSWVLLSPLATADVQRREEPYDYSSLNIWACMLCNDYLAGVDTQNHEYISDHIRSKHMIEHPVEGQHLICFMGSERPLRRHVMLVVGGEHPTSYRCSRCAQANPEAVKLFSMRGIRPHVMYTHFVELPGNDEWTEVELILDR